MDIVLSCAPVYPSSACRFRPSRAWPAGRPLWGPVFDPGRLATTDQEGFQIGRWGAAALFPGVFPHKPGARADEMSERRRKKAHRETVGEGPVVGPTSKGFHSWRWLKAACGAADLGPAASGLAGSGQGSGSVDLAGQASAGGAVAGWGSAGSGFAELPWVSLVVKRDCLSSTVALRMGHSVGRQAPQPQGWADVDTQQVAVAREAASRCKKAHRSRWARRPACSAGASLPQIGVRTSLAICGCNGI